MRTYHISTSAQIPLYEQLYRAIREDIMQGVLRGGERLPSKRKLAQHLKVSQITIETAYAQLVAEGYLISRPRSGYYVQEVPEQSHLVTPIELPMEKPKKPEYQYAFHTNTVDTACFPFATWAKLLRGELTEKASQLLAAAPPQGVLELRQEICRYLAEFRGIEAKPEQVIVGAGSEYLLMLLIQLLGRNRTYALENPGYHKLGHIFRANDAKVAPMRLDEQGLRLNDLMESDASVVYLTPSHQFPLGIVMPAARRIQMLHWAQQCPERYLIEDDYDSEFRYASKPIPAMKELDRADKVIYLNTFAKSLAPSLRISYLVLPQTLAVQYRNQLGFYACTVPSFEQYTLAKFLQTGSFERHISRIRNVYKNRRDLFLELLTQSKFSQAMQIAGEEAGLHLMLTLRNGLSETQMVQRAQEYGVHLHGLSDYYIAPPETVPPSTVVLGYGGLDATQMEQAVLCLERAWAVSDE